MSVLLTRHAFTVAEYHEMGRAGVLHEDDRVELIEGEIVDMAPIGIRHAAAVNALNMGLAAGCRGRAIVQIQGPVGLGPRSEPQPDVLVLGHRDDFYRSRGPEPGDVRLLVEVADTSLAYDQDVKLPLYARAGIPEVWIVDLSRNEVRVYREPAADGYRRVETHGRGAHVSPGAFPDLSVAVVDLVG